MVSHIQVSPRKRSDDVLRGAWVSSSFFQSVMIITKARDNHLISKTRELALWLMKTPRNGRDRGLVVCGSFTCCHPRAPFSPYPGPPPAMSIRNFARLVLSVRFHAPSLNPVRVSRSVSTLKA